MNLSQLAHWTIVSEVEDFSLTKAREAARELARELRALGYKLKTKDLVAEVDRIWYLREKRKANCPCPTVPAKKRVKQYLIKIAKGEIRQRRLSSPAGLGSEFDLALLDRDTKARLWLVGGEGWYKYSNRFGSRYQQVAYLCGKEDGQYFAVRVPGHIKTIRAAVSWLTPVLVRQAEANGRWTARQGDVYLIEMPRLGYDDLEAIEDTRHEWQVSPSGQRKLVHPQHQTIIVPQKVRWVRAVRQRQIDSSGRTYGD